MNDKGRKGMLDNLMNGKILSSKACNANNCIH